MFYFLELYSYDDLFQYINCVIWKAKFVLYEIQIYVIWKAKFMSNLCYMNGQICYMNGQIYVIWKANSVIWKAKSM